MLSPPPGIDGRRFQSMQEGQGWARCDPRMFLPSCRAFSSGKAAIRGQSRSLPWAPLQPDGFTGWMGSGATKWVRHQEARLARFLRSNPRNVPPLESRRMAARAPTGGGASSRKQDRYHLLHLPTLCPWAIARRSSAASKGSPMLSHSVVVADGRTRGWHIRKPATGCICRSNSARQGLLHAIYTSAADPGHTAGRSRVPLLWDKETGRSLNNESSKSSGCFNSAFNDIGADSLATNYPRSLRMRLSNQPLIYETGTRASTRCGYAKLTARPTTRRSNPAVRHPRPARSNGSCDQP